MKKVKKPEHDNGGGVTPASKVFAVESAKKKDYYGKKR